MIWRNCVGLKRGTQQRGSQNGGWGGIVKTHRNGRNNSRVHNYSKTGVLSFISTSVLGSSPFSLGIFRGGIRSTTHHSPSFRFTLYFISRIVKANALKRHRSFSPLVCPSIDQIDFIPAMLNDRHPTLNSPCHRYSWIRFPSNSHDAIFCRDTTSTTNTSAALASMISVSLSKHTSNTLFRRYSTRQRPSLPIRLRLT